MTHNPNHGKLFEDISFKAPELESEDLTIDAQYVSEQLAEIVKDKDLSNIFSNSTTLVSRARNREKGQILVSD